MGINSAFKGLIKNWAFDRISTLIIKGVSEGIVNVLGGGNIDYSE
jgi:hypothetical protein